MTRKLFINLTFCVTCSRIGFQYSLLIIILLVPQFLNGVLLPKRIVAQIGAKIKLPNYSSHEIDEAFNLGKNMVVQKLRLENELIKDGNL